MHRWLVLSLAMAVASSDAASADAPPGPVTPPSASTPGWFIGGRFGGAALRRNGMATFHGADKTWGFELGGLVRRDLAVVVSVDRGPHVERDVPYGENHPFARHALFATVLAEYRRSPTFYGAGGGLIHETTDETEWVYDHNGLLAGPNVVSESMNGAIGSIRVGGSLDTPISTLVLMAQGSVMYFPREAGTGYMATLVVGFRFPN